MTQPNTIHQLFPHNSTRSIVTRIFNLLKSAAIDKNGEHGRVRISAIRTILSRNLRAKNTRKNCRFIAQMKRQKQDARARVCSRGGIKLPVRLTGRSMLPITTATVNTPQSGKEVRSVACAAIRYRRASTRAAILRSGQSTRSFSVARAVRCRPIKCN